MDMNHRTTEPASAPIGHPAAENALPEDEYIPAILMVSGLAVTVGLGFAIGPGGAVAGLGLAGLFLFLGMVVEAAAARNRK